MVENRLLVVDDDIDLCHYIANVATDQGFEVAIANSDQELLDKFDSFKATVIVLDLQMPGKDGVEVLQYLTRQGFDGKVHLTSGMDRKVIESAANLAANLGLDIAGVFQKPITLEALEAGLTGSYLADDFAITSDSLRQGIEAGELILHYQPKVCVGQGSRLTVDSCEALVRWEQGEHGLVRPDQFIPLAEKEGLMELLTDAVIHCAMQQLKEWQESGITIKLAVNVPPHLLSNIAFVSRFSDQLKQFELAAENFIFEVTERTLIEDAVAAMETLTRLRILGAGLSIDDFGTGHSSLIQLHQMPFNEIKIDKSFIDDMEKSDDARTIVRAIINLAHGLNMTVCAEGVETQATLDMLRIMQCDTIQGYYFDPPLDAERMTRLLSDKKTYSAEHKERSFA